MQVTYTRSAPARAAARSRSLAARVDPQALAAWTLAFALVCYLALRGGGYDTVVRSEVGVAIWWIVLLAAAAGVLPMRFRVPGLVAIGLLAGFVAWTGLAVTWSESSERSVVELGRVAAYLGVLVLAIALQGATAARHTVNGLASAIGLITLIAVLSRLHPQAFGPNDHFAFLAETSARKLSYPLNYWNGLAAFAAIGVPLLLAVAVNARTLLGQAAAAAALPVTALCVEMTLSRGGVLAVAVGVAAFLVLAPRRLHAFATLAAAAAAGAILIWAVTRRAALDSGLPSPAALTQGSQVLWLLVIACAGVGLLQVALGLTARHVARPRMLSLDRRRLAFAWLAAGAVMCVIAVGAGAPGKVHDQWRTFTAPVGTVAPGGEATVFTRLSAANGNGRYEFWKSALDANATHPFKGIGPGTFELWWARHSTGGGFVRDAHTLYFETLAETGIVGFAALGGLFAFLLVFGVVRLLRARGELRVTLAAALAGVAAFMTSAALEWVWELAAIAVAVLALAAVIVAGREEAPPAPEPRARPLPRIALCALAVVALATVAIPLASALAIRDSQAAAADGRYVAALEDARTAERMQPYAATPHLQQALVLEQAGAIGPAVTAARAATGDEPTNWRTWVVLARLEARSGENAQALAAFTKAKQLNPNSNLFRTP
ncbi:O-antigen ligase family protein [Solirubrobacter ginsenosidimutans]|uniref:O-antigen ligase family protein n=1 Tax=Solirubrobacter ginsenosidimutans TaxID=490573 RepID=A0A9X3S1U9_9ACTN|nr:O-antigen ligase family protein [Solirubrobacter ginsenosidimutans]MDA0163860.1 O-antigen ligase family protein [Solirubrobacter ginsenosidimutans]